MELAAEQRLRRKHRLVFGDEGGRRRAGKRILDDLIVLGGTQKDADRGPLVLLLHVAIEGFDVEAQLSKVLGFEPADLEFEGDEASEASVKEQEVYREVLVAHLDRVFGTDETEIAAEFGDEAAEVPEQGAVDIGFGVVIR